MTEIGSASAQPEGRTHDHPAGRADSRATVVSSRGRRAPHRTRRSRADGRSAAGFLSPLVIGFGVFTVFPVVYSLVMSFYDWPVFGQRAFVGLRNYGDLFDSDSFRQVVRNTLLIVLVYVPLNIVCSLTLSIWISGRIRGRNWYRVLFFIPAVTPVVANALVWQLMFQPDGLAQQLWEAVLPGQAPNFLGEGNWAMAVVVLMTLWQGVGYNTLIFSAALDAMPADVLEAATLDGATGWRRLRTMVVPLISPSIFFALVMTLIGAFQIFSEPFILTGGGPGNATETLVTYLFHTGFKEYDMGLASAVAWIVFAGILVVTAVQFTLQKRWVHYDSDK
ncbi:carbohydrate ABC transporter permease [Streptomyces shenzhenensis]|uniref:carbohydrate ABC transporter permease n=1 Tax=Streptomyces shenzhenensis TaxID=943815 RepID=UPI003411AA9E